MTHALHVRAASGVNRRSVAAPLWSVTLLILAATACRRATQPPVTTSGAAQAPARQPGTALFPSGVVLRGDPAMLRYYLQNVDTVQGASVQVTYRPETVFIPRDAAIRALRGASWDGVEWRFDAAEPITGKLQPGSVMIVWGLAFRRVSQVERRGDEVVVRTEPAAFSDAVVDAKISWDAPLDLSQGMVSISPPKPEDSVSFRVAMDGVRDRPLVRFASFSPPSAPLQETEGAPDSADPAELYQHAFKLKVKEYEVALAFGEAGEVLNFYAQVAHGETGEEDVELPKDLADAQKYAQKFADAMTKKQEENEKEAKAGKKTLDEIKKGSQFGNGPGAVMPGYKGAPSAVPGKTDAQHQQQEEEEQDAEYEKKHGHHAEGGGKPNLPEIPALPKDFSALLSGVWDKVKEQTAIKVTAAGHITGLRSKGNMVYTGGKFASASFDYPDLHNVVDVRVVARSDKGVFASNTKLQIPISFRVPFIMGGLPFVFEIGCALIAAPGLTSKYASAKMALHFDMGEHLTMSLTGADAQASATPEVKAEKLPDQKATSLGPSAVMVALQGPRVGLALGVVGTSVGAYFDFVMSSSMAHTGSMGLIQCTRSLTFIDSAVGFEASVLGVSLDKLLPDQVSKVVRQPSFPQQRWEWVDPPGVKCQ